MFDSKTASKRIDVWVSKDGQETAFTDLKMDHLLNIVALLHRGWEHDNPQRHKLITLEKELLKRLAKMHPGVV